MKTGPAETQETAALAAPAQLLEFQRSRKEDSRNRLLAAAARSFCAQGYVPVSVEEIALAAGVSRMTFYRHFSGKADIATELFRINMRRHLPMVTEIGRGDYRDRDAVRAWISRIFAADREQRAILRAFIQANVIEAGFAEQGHGFIDEIIATLGETIPAFAIDAEAPADRRRVEARLLIYELLDQSNHAARDLGVAADCLIVEVLADRFITFVTR